MSECLWLPRLLLLSLAFAASPGDSRLVPWSDAFPSRGNPFVIRRPPSAPTPPHQKSLGNNEKDPKEFLVVCYWTESPNSWLNSTSSLQPKDLPLESCDVLNLMGWAGVKDLEIRWNPDFDWLPALKRVLRLKWKNPKLKLVLTIGTSSEMEELIKRPEAEFDTFAWNVRDFLLYSGLNGLDIDWEFPAWLRPWQQRPLFLRLISSLRSAFSSPSSFPTSLLLTLAVPAVDPIISLSYGSLVPEVARLVDWLSVMAYDYHGWTWYFPFTGHNAPLKRRQDEDGVYGRLNVEWSIARWIQLGAPKEKILLGIPTYGRNYRLLSPDVSGLRAPAVAGGWATYPDACRLGSAENASVVWDEEARAPYTSGGTNWISYDDGRSVEEKANLIKEKGLLGAMVFSLDTDDYLGIPECKNDGKKFPLVRKVSGVLKHN